MSRIEVDREGPTYTVETLRALKSEQDADLYFITGADAILEIVQWKHRAELFALAQFIAATRPGYDMAGFGVPGEARDAITMMKIPALAISSTDIRARVEAGGPIRYLVPEGVKSYIEKAGLYR